MINDRSLIKNQEPKKQEPKNKGERKPRIKEGIQKNKKNSRASE